MSPTFNLKSEDVSMATRNPCTPLDREVQFWEAKWGPPRRAYEAKII